MAFECVGLGEPEAAVVAVERAFAGVRPQVVAQTDFVGERFVCGR